MSNCDTLALINVYSPLQMARRILVVSRFIFICFISKTIPTKRRRKSENETHCTQTNRCTQTETEKTKDKNEKRRFGDNYPTQRFVASVRWNSQLPTAGGRFLNSAVGDRQRHHTLLLYKKKGGFNVFACCLVSFVSMFQNRLVENCQGHHAPVPLHQHNKSNARTRFLSHFFRGVKKERGHSRFR